MLTLVLFIACVGLLVMLVFACSKIESTQQEVRDEVKARRKDGIDFMVTLADLVKVQNEANLLRRLADQWDHPSEQHVLNQLANEKYKPGGPSMPSIWLRVQADMIEGKGIV